ncbi:MAG TPA: hypothetical protein VIY48_13350 [Candidatus Paceibacterota bacterium]
MSTTISSQQPDTKPGEYYVSVIDGKRTALLLGPFTNDHAAALAMVDRVRAKAEEIDPRAVWYSFGTVRLPSDDSVPIRAGKLNAQFGLPF